MNTKVLSALFLVIVTTGGAIADNRLSSGIITLRDGTQYDAIDIAAGCITSFTWEENSSGYLQRDGTFRVTRPEGDVAIAIRPETVRALVIADVSIPWVKGGVIEFQNGREIILFDRREIRVNRRNVCTVSIFDDFTESVQSVELSFTGDQAIARIDYNSIGTFRWSEASQQIFPNSFLFDPYTGERTEIRGEAD